MATHSRQCKTEAAMDRLVARLRREGVRRIHTYYLGAGDELGSGWLVTWCDPDLSDVRSRLAEIESWRAR